MFVLPPPVLQHQLRVIATAAYDDPAVGATSTVWETSVVYDKPPVGGAPAVHDA